MIKTVRSFAPLLAGCALLSSAAALAQVAPPAPDATAEAKGLDDIVVTARKRSESLQTVPLAIDAFSGEQLTARGAIKLDNLTQVSPNVFLTRTPDSPAGLYLTIRGLSQADIGLTTSASVGVYVDGVYLPFQLGLRQGLYDIDRVEILKGPQGTLYGKNTTGGAISVYTRQPSDELNGYAQATYARYDTRTLEGAINLPLAPGIAAVRVAGMLNRRDGLAHNQLGQPLDQDHTDSVRGHLLLTPNDRLSVTLSADYTKLRHGGGRERLLSVNTLGNPQGLPINLLVEASAELFGAANATRPANLLAAQQQLVGYTTDNADHTSTAARSNFKGSGVSGTIAYDLDWANFKSITAYRSVNRLDVLDTDATPFVAVFPTFDMHDKAFTQELNLGGTGIDDRLTWIVGAFYSRDTGHFNDVTFALQALNPTNPTVSAGNVVNKSYAGYAQGTYKISDALSLTAGYRYSEERKALISRNTNTRGTVCNIPVALRDGPGICQGTFDNKFTGSSYLFSLDYKIDRDVLVYAKTSHGFRGGGQQERGTSVGGSFTPFRPERATDYELGLKSDLLDRHLRFNLAAYYIDYTDIQRRVIQVDPATGALATIVANAATANIKGLEAELIGRISSQFTVGATAGYTDAKTKKFIDRGTDRSAERFPSPKGQFTLYSDLKLPTGFGSIAFHGDLYHQSAVHFDDSGFNDAITTQKAYELVNARITAHVDQVDADLALFATNLFNKQYLANAISLDTQLGMNIGYLGEPRIIGVQATKRF